MTEAARTPEEVPGAALIRMKYWSTSPGLREHLERAHDTGHRPSRTGPYVAVSRQAGTGGAEIGQLVAERLGWDYLGKELLDFMAHCFDMPRHLLEDVDETHPHWLQDLLGTWLDARGVSHEKFVVYLQRIVFLAGMYGRVVFVGRGAHCILPRHSGMSVRLVAPLEYRVAWQMKHRSATREQAQRTVLETDSQRELFHRRYFQLDVNDPGQYDLIINVSRFEPEQVCDQIVHALSRIKLDNSPAIAD